MSFRERSVGILTVVLIAVGGCQDGQTPTKPASSTGPQAAAEKPPAAEAAKPDAAIIAEHNRAVALMERYNYKDAADGFTKLAEKFPDWHDLRVNQAIAILNQDQKGDRALPILAEVLKADPEQARANYCRGLLLLHGGDREKALPLFQKVLELDPHDIYASYYVGHCLEEADQPQALKLYAKVLDTNPYFKTVFYRCFALYRHAGQTKKAMEMLAKFKELQNNPKAVTAEFKYRKMGPKAEVVTVDLEQPAVVKPVEGPIFQDSVPLLADVPKVQWSPKAASMTACDLDGDGLPELFLANAIAQGEKTSSAVLWQKADGGFQLDTKHPLAAATDVNAALWGDYDNDGRTDVYLCRSGPNQLWRQVDKNKWEDVTKATATAGGDANTIDGAIFDADHDGDLDLLLINGNAPNELLNNDRDGGFRPIAKQAGIAGDKRPSRGIVLADLDNDRDTDLIILKETPPHEAYLNHREWSYLPLEGLADFVKSPVKSALAGDLDADGLPEIYAVGPDGLLRWSRDEAGHWQREVLSAEVNNGSLALTDFTGDGSLELVAADENGWRVLRVGAKAEPVFAPSDGKVAAWSTVLMGCDQGPALAGLPVDGAPLLWRPGSARYPFLTVSLAGEKGGANEERSNTSGLGARVEVRVDSRWTVVHHLRTDSGPGQSLQPIAVGLGGVKEADFVRVIWPDGVLQSQLDVAAAACHQIVERNFAPSSCPILFVWSGQQYDFATDLLAVGGLGYLMTPGQYSSPDPTENYLLPVGLAAPRQGRYCLKLTEPMEEITLLDHAALRVHDLPPGWHMVLDERLGTAAPKPTGQPHYYRQAIVPTRAINERGHDEIQSLVDVDCRAADPGPLDGRFLGRLAQEHVLTLTFAQPIDNGPGKPVLVADGWVQFPYSQTMFATWQAEAAYQAPSIEARGSDGTWQMILDQVGYPGGMPRQMSVPLKNLPEGTTQLRVRTNLEVYWDRLMVAFAEPCPKARQTALGLQEARVAESGFSLRTVLSQRRPTFDYERRRPTADVGDPAGFYTEFGPALELVQTADDALAIIGPGEEIHLEFAAPTDGPPKGWTRRLVLEAVGWCKDMDLYTQHGETVEPLPDTGKPTEPRDRLHQKYNRRYQAGR